MSPTYVVRLPSFPSRRLAHTSPLKRPGAANREQQLDSDLQAHPSPHIGPDTHCLIAEQVVHVHRVRDEERANGSNASLATQMEHR